MQVRETNRRCTGQRNEPAVMGTEGRESHGQGGLQISFQGSLSSLQGLFKLQQFLWLAQAVHTPLRDPAHKLPVDFHNWNGLDGQSHE